MTNTLAILTALILSGCTVSLTGHAELSATFAHGLQGEADGGLHVTPIPVFAEYWLRRKLLLEDARK